MASGVLTVSEYIGIVIFIVLAAAVAGAMVLLASTLGPKKPSPVKAEPFECGKTPFLLPAGHQADVACTEPQGQAGGLAPPRLEAAQDLLWGLINSPAFLFNR